MNIPKNIKDSKKLGRNEEVSPEDLLKRYAALKRFLEDNWGRFGLQLPRARKPERVLEVLNLVPNAKWAPAFRDFPTGCLLREGFKRVTWRTVRETREKFERAKSAEGQLSMQSHTAYQSAQSVRTAFDAAVAEYKHQDSKQAQRRLRRISKQLHVEQLTKKAQKLDSELRVARINRERLGELLKSKEAWLARSEVAAFVRDPKRRYSKTPANFAKAMAGLPFYDWLYSLRKCQKIPGVADVPRTYWFQVFEMLQEIVKKTKSTDLNKIELKLKKELLKSETDSHLRSYISPQWFYMTLALADCRGKRFHQWGSLG